MFAPVSASVPVPTLTTAPPVPAPGCAKALPLSLTMPEIVPLAFRPPSVSRVAPSTTLPAPESAPSERPVLAVTPETSTTPPAALVSVAFAPVELSAK